jgi:PAS domain S-box-containing protein
MRQWFHNLKVSQKLMLISIFFVMPDSVMLYLFITGINANIHFAEMEIKGNVYQRPLEELLELLPEHRFLADRASAGDASAAAQLPHKENQIDAAFESLREVNERIGAELQFTDEGLAKRSREHYRPSIARAEWQDLKAHSAGLDPAARAEGHLRLIASVRMMITHAGDMSNLILDPDLDSYYLMDATLLALPETQDRLAAVMAHGEAVLNQASLSPEEKQQFAIYGTLLKEADLDRIRGSVQTALNEDENFYGISPTLQARVPPLLKQYIEAAEAFIELTDRIVNEQKSGVTAQEYFAAGDEARQASFKLWKVADEEVDTLLQARIVAYEHRRTRSLMVAACALLAAIGFVTFITRSISGPLLQQAAALKKANETLQAEIAERKRAEEELRRSEAQLAAAQKIAKVGSWGWDVGSNVVNWSEENYRILGFEPREMTPTYDLALHLVHPDDRAMSEAAIKGGKPFSFEQRIVRRDGTERVLHQRGDVIMDGAGNVARVFGTAQDITERKQAEEHLEEVHQQLMEVSRRAGMAEVATGVLHNVGNVLNSVNVSTLLISDRLSKSRVTHLSKVSALLNENAANLGEFLTKDPKGVKLPSFIASLAERLGVEQAELLREAEGLSKNIAHIKDIVAVQQSYAKVSGIVESLSPAALVEDALEMNDAAFDRHRVEVLREFEETPPVRVDKHKALQVLVNLFSNAKYAVSESMRLDKRITVRISANGDRRVKIAVSDNGVGIAPENLARIFAHGFTTKINGHGFGLHSAALAATETGGSLSAHSDGPERGATFILELPMDDQLNGGFLLSPAAR